MKKIAVLFAVFLVASCYSITCAAESPSEIDPQKEKIPAIENSKQAPVKKKNQAEKSLIGELKNEPVLINDLLQQHINETNILSEKIKSLETSSDGKNANQDIILNALHDQLMSQGKELKQINNLFQQKTKQLEDKIASSEQNTSRELLKFDNMLTEKTRYWVVTTFGLAVILLIFFLALKAQLKKEKTRLSEDIQKTKKFFEEEGVRLDNKLTELLV